MRKIITNDPEIHFGNIFTVLVIIMDLFTFTQFITRTLSVLNHTLSQSLHYSLHCHFDCINYPITEIRVAQPDL